MQVESPAAVNSSIPNGTTDIQKLLHEKDERITTLENLVATFSQQIADKDHEISLLKQKIAELTHNVFDSLPAPQQQQKLSHVIPSFVSFL
jgi:hypothetical protein